MVKIKGTQMASIPLDYFERASKGDSFERSKHVNAKVEKAGKLIAGAFGAFAARPVALAA